MASPDEVPDPRARCIIQFLIDGLWVEQPPSRDADGELVFKPPRGWKAEELIENGESRGTQPWARIKGFQGSMSETDRLFRMLGYYAERGDYADGKS